MSFLLSLFSLITFCLFARETVLFCSALKNINRSFCNFNYLYKYFDFFFVFLKSMFKGSDLSLNAVLLLDSVSLISSDLVDFQGGLFVAFLVAYTLLVELSMATRNKADIKQTDKAKRWNRQQSLFHTTTYTEPDTDWRILEQTAWRTDINAFSYGRTDEQIDGMVFVVLGFKFVYVVVHNTTYLYFIPIQSAANLSFSPVGLPTTRIRYQAILNSPASGKHHHLAPDRRLK